MKFESRCCFQSHIQQYECSVVRGGVAMDGCLWQELAWLWEQGVKTVGSCCGHHTDCGLLHKPYIQVDYKSAEIMQKLGYKKIFNPICPKNMPLFEPKTVIIDSYDKFPVTRKYL